MLASLMFVFNKKKLGETAFSVHAPIMWNSLPVYIHQAPSLNIFKKQRKTYIRKPQNDSGWSKKRKLFFFWIF